jgi:hypothetical protein
MATDEQNQYTPGVCNIGRAETLRRRKLGWISTAVTIVLLMLLLWAMVNPWLLLLTFFPATMAASGFLQAHYHFCSGFARQGVFNFGQTGATSPIGNEASKQKDQSRVNQITLYAVVIGLATAIICVLLAYAV